MQQMPAIIAKKHRFKDKAAKLLKSCKSSKGYCLILGSQNAELGEALAAGSDMKVIIRCTDEKISMSMRQSIAACGLEVKVKVHCGALYNMPYNDYLFNLIVADAALTASIKQEMKRLCQPFGGVMYYSPSGKAIIRQKLKGAGKWTHFYGDVIL